MDDAQRREWYRSLTPEHRARIAALNSWSRTLDKFRGAPPGTWLAENVGGRVIEDLDLDEIEVFCVLAKAHYAIGAKCYKDRWNETTEGNQ